MISFVFDVGYLELGYCCQCHQGRNFREAMKAMAVVAPQFGLVPLQKITWPEATVAFMPQLTCNVDTSVFCWDSEFLIPESPFLNQSKLLQGWAISYFSGLKS